MHTIASLLERARAIGLPAQEMHDAAGSPEPEGAPSQAALLAVIALLEDANLAAAEGDRREAADLLTQTAAVVRAEWPRTSHLGADILALAEAD